MPSVSLYGRGLYGRNKYQVNPYMDLASAASTLPNINTVGSSKLPVRRPVSAMSVISFTSQALLRKWSNAKSTAELVEIYSEAQLELLYKVSLEALGYIDVSSQANVSRIASLVTYAAIEITADTENPYIGLFWSSPAVLGDWEPVDGTNSVWTPKEEPSGSWSNIN